MIYPITGRTYIGNANGTKVMVLYKGRMHYITNGALNRWLDSIVYQDCATGEVFTMSVENFSYRFRYENRDSEEVQNSLRF